MKNISRRTAIKTVLAGSAAMAVSGMEAAAPAKKKKVEKPEPLKGNIRHSVSKWCFGSYPLDEFCEICKHRNRINRTARPERLAYRAETWFDGCDGAGCGFRYRQGVQ